MAGGFLKLKGFQSPMTSLKPKVILNIMQSTRFTVRIRHEEHIMKPSLHDPHLTTFRLDQHTVTLTRNLWVSVKTYSLLTLRGSKGMFEFYTRVIKTKRKSKWKEVNWREKTKVTAEGGQWFGSWEFRLQKIDPIDLIAYALSLIVIGRNHVRDIDSMNF